MKFILLSNYYYYLRTNWVHGNWYGWINSMNITIADGKRNLKSCLLFSFQFFFFHLRCMHFTLCAALYFVCVKKGSRHVVLIPKTLVLRELSFLQTTSIKVIKDILFALYWADQSSHGRTRVINQNRKEKIW